VRLLARREHAAGELADKLTWRGFDRDAVDDALERLATDGWQSDERFAAQFVGERAGKGEGPVKIRAALTERGIATSVADDALTAYDGTWLDRACAVCRRRFGDQPPGDWRERGKRARYLQQRGFPPDIVRKVTDFDDGAADA